MKPGCASPAPPSSTLQVFQILSDPNRDGTPDLVVPLVEGTDATAERWTYFYDKNKNGRQERGELSQIDHVLVSKDLTAVPQLGMRIWYGEYDAGASDHRPLFLKLTTDGSIPPGPVAARNDSADAALPGLSVGLAWAWGALVAAGGALGGWGPLGGSG